MTEGGQCEAEDASNREGESAATRDEKRLPAGDVERDGGMSGRGRFFGIERYVGNRFQVLARFFIEIGKWIACQDHGGIRFTSRQNI